MYVWDICKHKDELCRHYNFLVEDFLDKFITKGSVHLQMRIMGWFHFTEIVWISLYLMIQGCHNWETSKPTTANYQLSSNLSLTTATIVVQSFSLLFCVNLFHFLVSKVSLFVCLKHVTLTSPLFIHWPNTRLPQCVEM